MNSEEIKLRREVQPGDPDAVERIVISTGFFRPDEVKVAVEITEERLSKGTESGYEFIFAEKGGNICAFACFGQIPCSLVSWDLYWIATSKEYQNMGLGKILLKNTEEIVKAAGGKTIYIETSSKPLYEATRQFYLRNGCTLKVRMEDFYDIGDDKMVYIKKL